MTFREIFRFEVAYQLRRGATWLYAVLFVLLAYLATTGMLAEEARRSGEVHADAPVAVALATVVLSWMGTLATAGLFGEAALRDLQWRMHPLFYTAPLGRANYLGGRFAGAFVAHALVLAAVPLGLMAAARSGAVEAPLLGPFDAAAYLRPYAFVLLPNLFATAAVLYALVVVSRQLLAGYGGVLLLFAVSMVSEEVVAEQLGQGWIAALLDPFGFTVMSERSAYLTPSEMNVLPVALEGALLWNRLLWLGLGALVLACTCAGFRFAHPAPRDRRARVRAAGAAPARRLPRAVSQPPRAFGPGTYVRQVLAVAGRSFRDVAGRRAFAAVAAGAVALVLTLGVGVLQDDYGTPYWPVTQLLTGFLSGFVVALTVSLLTSFFAGEMVWRERDAGLSEIADAAPVPDWVPFAGKLVALGLLLVVVQAVLMGAGLLVQLLQGYYAFEPGLYGRVLFGLQLADYLLLAVLAMAVHVVVDHKAVGHMVVGCAYVATVFAGRLGVGHRLLVYAADPGWVYSDLSGFGPFVAPLLWFKLYWAGWALLLAVAASLLWVRGRERGAGPRLRLARLRLTRPVAAAAAVGGVLVLGTGGFVFYNTNVLNAYRSDEDEAARRADYERRYGRYEGAPQPQVTGTRLHVELYPRRREAEVRGTYRLENRTGTPVDSVHLFVHPDVETRAVVFDRAARPVLLDDALGHRIYALDTPLRPGDTLRMTFHVRFAPRGFSNGDPNTSVVGNGTYFDHTGGRNPGHRRWLPVVGYQPARALDDAAARRAHGLPPRSVPTPRDTSARYDPAGREWIDFEAVVGTDADQTAVAPGTLRETWTEGGRRYFRYATDAPVKNAYAFFSARYAVREAVWNGVHIRLFHHPGHGYNVDRMLRSARASLAYYTRHFGPYPHRELRIVEFPRYAHFAHAYPGTISYAEGFGFLTRVGEGDVDLPFTVVAHEVAHQWWGYQVVPASVEGFALLSEVLAQYGALMVLEEAYGPEHVRRFLGQLRVEYLNRRTSRDVPLLRATHEQNLAYRKGALAMYALRAYVGERQVNTALRRLLAAHRAGEPPYPSAADLYAELQAVTPAPFRHLLTDLFETNTLWRLRTTAARAEPAGTGAWRVTLEVEAGKVRVDGDGGEREVPMDDWVEVGVFASAAPGAPPGEPLYLGKHRLRSGRQTVTVTVPRAPGRAGVDPYHLLLDREIDRNLVVVQR